MKKITLSGIVLEVIFEVLIISCPFGADPVGEDPLGDDPIGDDPIGDDPIGGDGADFDDSLYYTKTEVEALINDLRNEARAYAESLTLPGAWEDSVNFDSSTTTGNSGVLDLPEQIMLAVIKVEWSNPEPNFPTNTCLFVGPENPIDGIDSARGAASFTMAMNGMSTNGSDVITVCPSNDNSLSVWVEFEGGGTLNENLKAEPILFIREQVWED